MPVHWFFRKSYFTFFFRIRTELCDGAKKVFWGGKVKSKIALWPNFPSSVCLKTEYRCWWEKAHRSGKRTEGRKELRDEKIFPVERSSAWQSVHWDLLARTERREQFSKLSWLGWFIMAAPVYPASQLVKLSWANGGGILYGGWLIKKMDKNQEKLPGIFRRKLLGIFCFIKIWWRLETNQLASKGVVKFGLKIFSKCVWKVFSYYLKTKIFLFILWCLAAHTSATVTRIGNPFDGHPDFRFDSVLNRRQWKDDKKNQNPFCYF